MGVRRHSGAREARARNHFNTNVVARWIPGSSLRDAPE